MDIVLIIIAGFCMLIGLAGAILPGLPGAPLSYIGLLLMQATDKINFSTRTLVIGLIIVVITTVLDYIIPAYFTKRYGGSKYGVWGSLIGLVVGLLTPLPLGMIWGPFLGAIIGELIAGKSNEEAFRSGVGNFIGFICSTGLKIAVGIGFCGIYIHELIQLL